VSIPLRTTDLTKRYGETLAVDRLTLELREGEVYGFLGPNGSGKTTTIRVVLGLHRPTAGSATIFGIDAWRHPVEAHRRVAYVAGEPALWPHLSGRETLEFLGRMHGSVDTAYRQTLIERFDLDQDKRIRALSKGNRQKIQLVAALATRADLLVLDEPTAGLDPLMEVTFRQCVAEAKARGQTVFLSSHILSEVEAVCDRVGILRAGRLIEEGPLSDMRHLSHEKIEVTFAGPVPDLAPPDGVTVARVSENTLSFEVAGSVGPLLHALDGRHVVGLRSREPSLEEVFLHYYGASDHESG
jgi:ABC-2 type transport system ATP-binding protein